MLNRPSNAASFASRPCKFLSCGLPSVVEHRRFRQLAEFVGDLIDRLAPPRRGGGHWDNQADLAEQRQQGLLHLGCERLNLLPIGSIFKLV